MRRASRLRYAFLRRPITCVTKIKMKTLIANCGIALLLAGGIGLAAQTAKDDIKDAGRATKDAAQDTGRATKKTAKKAGRKVKNGTKKATNKAAGKTEEGADRVRQKTEK